LRKTISRKDAKVPLDGRNDGQRPIDKLVSGRRDKNPAGNICASTYYSEKEQKHVADFFGRDIFLRYDALRVSLAEASLCASMAAESSAADTCS
jgi:hypothetical protein